MPLLEDTRTLPQTMSEDDELRLLRALLRASDYGVLLSDADRRDRIGNKRFCELFGMDSLDTLLSQPDYVRRQLVARLKDPDGFVRTLDAIYADPRRVVEDEVELTAPRPRLLRRYTAPVLGDDGAVIGRLWTFLDITRARGMEDKIRAQAAQLERTIPAARHGTQERDRAAGQGREHAVADPAAAFRD